MYWYIVRNGFLEQNQSWVSFFTRTLQPIVTIAGYYLFYQYLISHSPQFSLSLYYGYIILVSVIDVPRFADQIQKDIQSERYIVIDRLPIHPFIYYFWRNIGRSMITILATTIIALITFTSNELSISEVLLILLAGVASILLIHLLSFIISTIIFYTEQLNLWMFGMLFEFLGGKIIPLVALPTALQFIFVWIIPFGLASGSIAFHLAQGNYLAIGISLLLTICWTFILYQISKTIWDQGGFYFQDRH